MSFADQKSHDYRVVISTRAAGHSFALLSKNKMHRVRTGKIKALSNPLVLH